MRLSQAWIVALKDFEVFATKKNIIYSIFIVPFIVSTLLPLVTWYAVQYGRGGGITPAQITVLLPTFTYFYFILAGLTPSVLASYSIVGEKVENCLEPLLATPTTDGEVLFGKGISGFLPPVATIVLGAAMFMILDDAATYGKLGSYFFPNTNADIVLFLMVPLAVVVSVEWNVLVSSRVSDVRIAQQVGMLVIVPFAGIYVASDFKLVSLADANNLLLIAGALAVIALLFLFLVRVTFRREAILTRWK